MYFSVKDTEVKLKFLFWFSVYIQTSAYKIKNVFHLKKNAIECYDKKVKTDILKIIYSWITFTLAKYWYIVQTINNNQSYELVHSKLPI